MAIVALIPARFASTRLPGKPLALIHGKPMVQHVWERARLARTVDRVIVATDDARIADAVRAFGGEAVLTSPAHASGTDRLAEAVIGLPDAGIVVNVQGDEPLLDPGHVEAAVAPLVADPGLPMGTVAVPLTSIDQMLDPAVVKVVVDAQGNALYFSRAPIPLVRGGDLRAGATEAVRRGLARRHLGIYVYRREALLRIASLPPAPLEAAESLEQLRALHHGIRIRVVDRPWDRSVAVDTPEDLERVRALLASTA